MASLQFDAYAEATYSGTSAPTVNIVVPTGATLLVVGITGNNNRTYTASAGGNAMTLIRQDIAGGTGTSNALFYLANPSAGSVTVTVTITGGSDAGGIFAAALFNTETSSPIDTHGFNSDSSGTSTATSVTTTQAKTLLVGLVLAGHSSTVPDSAETMGGAAKIGSSPYQYMSYKYVDSAGSKSMTANSGSSGFKNVTVAAIKQAASIAAGTVVAMNKSLEFDTTNADYKSISRFPTTNRVVAAWRQSSTVINVQCFDIDTVTGRMTALGSAVDIEGGTASGNGIAVQALDSTNFIAAWCGASGDGFVRLYTIDGSGNITPRDPAVEFDTTDGDNMTMTLMNSNSHVLCCYTGPSGDGFAVIFQCNTAGGFISALTPFEFDTGDFQGGDVVKLSSTKALVVYQGVGSELSARVLDINTSTWDVSGAGSIALLGITNVRAERVVAIDTAGSPMKVIIGWGDTGSSKAKVRSYQINTSTWAITTFGSAETDLDSGGFADWQSMDISAINGTNFLAFFQGTDGDGFAKVMAYNASNGAITAAANVVEFDTSIATEMWSVPVNDDGSLHVAIWSGTDHDGFIRGFSVETSSPVNFNATVLACTFSLPASTVTAIQNVSISPTTLTATFNFIVPTITAETNINPTATVLSLTFSIPAFTVTSGAGHTGSALELTMNLIAPTISVVRHMNPVATTLELTFSTPASSITADANTTVNVSTLSLSFSIPTYAVGTSAIIEVSALAMTFSIPTYSVGTFINVTATVLTVTVSIVTPTVAVVRLVNFAASPLSALFSIPAFVDAGGVWRKVGQPTDSWTKQSISE